MPSRNVTRIDIPESYYHVYARGASRQRIFLDEEDHAVFLNLLKRYLSKEPARDALGREYANYHDTVELLAFCLMPNHYHLMLYQEEAGAISHLMRGVGTSYSRYFNKKHGRTGSLFENRFKASRISNDTYLMHISRYIHLNPKDWDTWPYSSLPYYKRRHADWIQPERVLELFDNDKDKYMDFTADYEEYRDTLKNISHELADK